jgi:hypothetical protein
MRLAAQAVDEDAAEAPEALEELPDVATAEARRYAGTGLKIACAPSSMDRATDF